MNNRLLHTPDGVRDIYNSECRKIMKLSEKIHNQLIKYGCSDIKTPTLEFFNVYDSQNNAFDCRNMYKFFDKDGEILVLRPDYTPAIARCVAKYYKDETLPLRFCYEGNTFINQSDYQGRLKETTQCGAEYIGDSSSFADAEMLALVVDSLKSVGLDEFQLSIGHALYYEGLVKAASLSLNQEEEIKSLIVNKNFLGLEKFIKTLDLENDLLALFEGFNTFSVDIDKLNELEKYAQKYDRVLFAIQNLQELYKLLKLYKIDEYVSFELGMISIHNYYTGMIFSGYTYGSGEPIVKGGRYDKLISRFGKDTPAIGFTIVVDQVMDALKNQSKQLEESYSTELLVFSEDRIEEAINIASKLRKDGKNIQTLMKNSNLSKEDYYEYAKKMNISRVEFL
ncbi:ATP phosphoribosyltransferase regulatory subunit [Lachnobacterium bovis]|uniref:ATP phosphoribosyltransferase regulatory subunit n=1 Tax=Lachnobacterium bovis DSM 14045 TaxID=1122142 RepID=A0A1H3FNJ2_9FIRM|nr:ATP phosphoribosyltransferase regulatory subunit [Lachnobacterium bovis]SDX91699.1 ATP phosphoribosyltransferase regulatory subunit [Lachnobacterium bovis DSM 14045]